MSSTSPPDPNINTFNNLYWTNDDEGITKDDADKRYLRFPIAQGKETFKDIQVNGISTFANNTNFNGGSNNFLGQILIGGFGSINLQAAPLFMYSGSRIDQIGLGNSNNNIGNTNFNGNNYDFSGNILFRNNVSFGNAGYPNNTPIIYTYKSSVYLGYNGQGTIFLECPLAIGNGGFIGQSGNGVNTFTSSYFNGIVNFISPDVSGNTDITTLKSTLPTFEITKRTYQMIDNGQTWENVNGHYALAKQSYPALNPYSSGVSAVSSWDTRANPNNYGFLSVCWSPELRLFVAVASTGSNDKVITSPNGINWTTRTTPFNLFTGVVWAAELGLFCSVAFSGAGNRVMTSPDGITWTSRFSAADNNWRGLCWSAELRLFVAVAYSAFVNGVMTSPNGFNWTLRTAPERDWNSVCWSPELKIFVAVGTSGVGTRVMTSPDGVTWTIRNSAADNSWVSVCWSKELGLFVAVSTSGTGNRVMTSPDGINWTSRTSAADNFWSSVCWVPELGLFVAVAQSGTGNRIMTSSNGINWTTRTSPADNNWTSVCWAPEIGILCSVASSGTNNRVMTSSLLGRPPTSYNVFDSPFNNIDNNGNWDFKAKNLGSNDNSVSLGSSFSNTLIRCNQTGVGGEIQLQGGTGLVAPFSSGFTGQHLVLRINGTQYKIRLENM